MQTTRYFFLMVIMMQHWVLLWFPVMRYVISRPVWGTHQAPSVHSECQRSSTDPGPLAPVLPVLI